MGLHNNVAYMLQYETDNVTEVRLHAEYVLKVQNAYFTL